MNRRYVMAPTIYVVLLMVPIYWLVIMSFKTNGEIGGGLTLLPRDPTLASYRTIFHDPAWYLGYVNATIYVLLNVAISVLVALPAAFAFSRYRFFGDRALFFGFLAFRMIAPAILFVPMVQIFSDLSLIDTHIAVAIAHCIFNVPIAIWILEGFISSVPREMDQQAQVDGYSLPRFFIRILMPQIAPGIAVTAFFCFMFSWVELLLANALTTVHAKPIGAIMTRAGGVLSADLAQLSAAGVLMLVPGLIFIVLVRRYLLRGLSLGRAH